MNQLVTQIQGCTKYSLYSILKKVVPALKKIRWHNIKGNAHCEKRTNIISLLVQKFKQVQKTFENFSTMQYFKYCLKKLKDQSIEPDLFNQLKQGHQQKIIKCSQDSTKMIAKMDQILMSTFCPTCTKYVIKTLPFHVKQNGHQVPLFIRDFKSIHQEQLTKIMCAIANQSKGTIIVTKSHTNLTPLLGFQKFPGLDQKNLYSMLENSLALINHLSSGIKIRVQKVNIMSLKQYLRQKQQEKRAQQQKKLQGQNKKQTYTSKFAKNFNKQKSKLLKHEQYVIRINIEASESKKNRIFYKQNIGKGTNKKTIQLYALQGRSQDREDGDKWKIKKYQGEELYLRMVKMGNRRSTGKIKQHSCSFHMNQKDEIQFCSQSFPNFEKAYKEPLRVQKKQPCQAIQPYKSEKTQKPKPTSTPTANQFTSKGLFDNAEEMGAGGPLNFNYCHSSVKTNKKVFKTSTENCKMISAHPYSSTFTCIKLGGGSKKSLQGSSSSDTLKCGNTKQNEPLMLFESKLNDVFTKCTIKKVGNGFLQTKSILQSQFHWVQTQKSTDCVMSYKETTQVQFYSNQFQKQKNPKYQYTNFDSIKYM